MPKGPELQTTVVLRTATQHAWDRDLHGQGANVIEPEQPRMHASTDTITPHDAV